MSAIAGVVVDDGGPADPDLLARMAAALAFRGPDGTGHRALGAAGLVRTRLHAVPGSEREPAVLSDPAADLHLVLDGRLDDPEALAAELRAAGTVPREATDGELVLRAAALWGEEAPARLRGDFAFALWDGRRRVLLAARDALGVRPFLWAERPGAFLFASEYPALFADPGVGRRPDEGVVAEHLARCVVTAEETLFAGVRRLPPGHLLVVERGRVRVRPWWDPGPGRGAPGRTAEEDAERLRGVLEAAVRARLRSPGPVALEVSGGVDSSSVAAVAGDLERRGLSPAPALEAVSVVFPGLSCDEAAWSRAATDALGIPARVLRFAEAPPEAFAEQVRLHFHIPDDPAGATMLPALEDARARGIRVRLGGEGGDEWFGWDTHHLADLLRGGRLRALLREARGSAGEEGARRALVRVLLLGVRPLVPPAFRGALRRVRGAAPAPPWMDPGLCRRVSLADRVRQDPGRGRFPTHAQADLWRECRTGTAALGVEMADRQAARYGVEVRHPFQDRAVAEFALSLPRERRVRDGVPKAVLREAVAGLLPPRILSREDKADFSPLHLRALRRAGGPERFARTALAEAGWVDERVLLATARRTLADGATADPRFHRDLGVLWAVHGLDLWLRIAV